MSDSDAEALKKMKARLNAKSKPRIFRTPEERAQYETYLKSLNNRMQAEHGESLEPPPAKS